MQCKDECRRLNQFYYYIKEPASAYIHVYGKNDGCDHYSAAIYPKEVTLSVYAACMQQQQQQQKAIAVRRSTSYQSRDAVISSGAGSIIIGLTAVALSMTCVGRGVALSCNRSVRKSEREIRECSFGDPVSAHESIFFQCVWVMSFMSRDVRFPFCSFNVLGSPGANCCRFQVHVYLCKCLRYSPIIIFLSLSISVCFYLCMSLSLRLSPCVSVSVCLSLTLHGLTWQHAFLIQLWISNYRFFCHHSCVYCQLWLLLNDYLLIDCLYLCLCLFLSLSVSVCLCLCLSVYFCLSIWNLKHGKMHHCFRGMDAPDSRYTIHV